MNATTKTSARKTTARKTTARKTTARKTAPKPESKALVTKEQAETKPEPKAKPLPKMPRRASKEDVLIAGRPYRPRKGTKFSTIQQWSFLNDAMNAGLTVEQIMTSEDYRAVWVDAGYLDYVLSRGWVVVKTKS